MRSRSDFLAVRESNLSLTHSVMILMSDDLPEGRGLEGSAHQHAGIVTHPFVTQTYRCVEAYETKDTKNRPFKVTVDEKLDVLIKDPAGQSLSFHASYFFLSIIFSHLHTNSSSFLGRLVVGGE